MLATRSQLARRSLIYYTWQGPGLRNIHLYTFALLNPSWWLPGWYTTVSRMATATVTLMTPVLVPRCERAPTGLSPRRPVIGPTQCGQRHADAMRRIVQVGDGHATAGEVAVARPQQHVSPGFGGTGPGEGGGGSRQSQTWRPPPITSSRLTPATPPQVNSPRQPEP